MKIKKSVLYLSVFVFIPFFISVAYGEKVHRVIDGDTFILENGQRVRMIGIDAPEIDNKKYKKIGEPFGVESKLLLKQTIQGKDVVLRSGKEPYDKYSRRLAYVFLEDETFVNRMMVRLGLAETFRRFPFKYKQEFLDLEYEAKQNKIGMWKDNRKPLSQKWKSFIKSFNR